MVNGIMINAGRQITWLGTNLCNIVKVCQVNIRTVSTGKGDHQAQEKPQQSEEDVNSKPSNFEPPKPVVPRSYLDEFRRPMKPFMKELFCGRADTTIFSYPDVIDNDSYYDMFNRCSKVKDTLNEKKDLVDSIDNEGRVSKDLLLALKSQGFYALNVPENEGGEGLSVTESLRLIEELSVNLSLSENIITPATLGYKALQLFGTDSQKAKYLPSLISGQKIGTICISDDACGSDPVSVSIRHLAYS